MVSSYGVKGLRAHSGDLGSALSLTTHTTVGKKKKKKKKKKSSLWKIHVLLSYLIYSFMTIKISVWKWASITRDKMQHESPRTET